MSEPNINQTPPQAPPPLQPEPMSDTTQPALDNATPPLKVRQVGPYLLESLLGSGGFGEVWLATRQSELVQTRLAVKLPHPSRVNLEAIRQEAGLWAKVAGHPNILPIFEASVYNGQIVIVSEYVAGGSLADWLVRSGGRAPTHSEAVRLILGILSGLEHLHNVGVVHRDIKPANVLLQNGMPRLADFGISRALHHESDTEVPAGTPSYMAPEAFDGIRSIQTDLWSVGVLFYLLLSGSLPFPEVGWTSLLKSVVLNDPRPLPADIPNVLTGVIQRCLAKEPRNRFRSAADMAEALSQTLVAPSPANTVRVLGHFGVFAGTLRPCLFINVTNLSETTDREVTHIWIETNPQIHVTNARRPLPKRLRPQETWETWIELWQLPHDLFPRDLKEDRVSSLVRVRLSTGEILNGSPNPSVPEQGRVPGEPPSTGDVGELPTENHPALPQTGAQPQPPLPTTAPKDALGSG